MSYDLQAPLTKVRGETRKANQALRDYCHMGPGRSLAALAELYQATTDHRPPTTSVATVKMWNGKYAWQDRLLRWESLQMAADEAAWAERRDHFRKKAFDLAVAGLDKFEDMLAWPLHDTEVIETDDEGRPTIVKIEPGPWNYTSAAKLLAEANKVALLALGEVTESTEQRHTGLSVNIYANMEDEELNDNIDQLMVGINTEGPGTPGQPTEGEETEGENQGD